MWAPPAKLGQDIKVFLLFHKNKHFHYKGIPFINEWGTFKDPLLKHLVSALELKGTRSQRLMNRFSIGWTFFPMPPTWKSRWCYYFGSISHLSSIPSAEGFFHARKCFFLWNNNNPVPTSRGSSWHCSGNSEKAKSKILLVNPWAPPRSWDRIMS